MAPAYLSGRPRDHTDFGLGTYTEKSPVGQPVAGDLDVRRREYYLFGTIFPGWLRGERHLLARTDSKAIPAPSADQSGRRESVPSLPWVKRV